MRYVAVAFALVVLPAPAAAQEVCAALERLAAAAREPSPFASIGRALAAREAVVPGFRAEDCRVASVALSCGTRDFVADHFDGWPDPLPCPGIAPAAVAQRIRGTPHAYTLSGLHIEYGIDCMGCAGGARSYFSATIGPRRRPED